MRLIIIFVAMALALGAFVLTMQFTAKPPAPPEIKAVVVDPKPVVPEVPTVDVYIAKVDMAPGEIVKQEALDIQPWPRHLVNEDMIPANSPKAAEIVKMIVRTPFSRGEPIIINKLANDKDPSFISASLGEGMRLVSVAVDAISGGGGFVFPGDKVDVLITHDVTFDSPRFSAMGGLSVGGMQQKSPVTELLIRNVKVLAVNQKTSSKPGEPLQIPTNISLELSLVDAQKIRLLENGNGRMSLLLRSLKESEVVDAPLITRISDLSNAPKLGEFKEVTVVKGVNAQSVGVSLP